MRKSERDWNSGETGWIPNLNINSFGAPDLNIKQYTGSNNKFSTEQKSQEFQGILFVKKF